MFQCLFCCCIADYNDVVLPASLSNLTLTKSQPESCFNISIVDDQFFEGTETFSLSLFNIGGDQVALGSPSTTIVNIMDTDGDTVT